MSIPQSHTHTTRATGSARRLHALLLLLAMMAGSSITSLASSDFETLANALGEMSLPLVDLRVDISKVEKASWTPAQIEIADPLARTDGKTRTVLACFVRYRGNNSMSHEKKSFAIKLVDVSSYSDISESRDPDEFEDLDANVLGIRSENSWILDAMAIDRLRMRNRLLTDLWNSVSQTPYSTSYARRNGTKGEHVEVFVNGAYHGLYCLSDKIDRKLLNLRKAKGGTPRGVLYKLAITDNYTDRMEGYPEGLRTDTAAWGAWELKLPEDYPSETAWAPLIELIDFATKSSNSEFAGSYCDKLHHDNLIDYFTLVIAFGLTDNVAKNYYLSACDIGQSRQLLITPWDMDASLGTDWQGLYLANDEAPATALAKNALVRRIYNANTDNFRNKLHARLQELMQGKWSVAATRERMSATASRLMGSGAWAREVARWGNNPVPLRDNLLEECEIALSFLEAHQQKAVAKLAESIMGIGDVNNDQQVTMADVAAEHGMILGSGPTYPLEAADVNGDKKITVADVTAILDLLTGAGALGTFQFQ